MKRTVTALLLVLCLLVSAAGLGEEKTAPLYADGAKAGELRIRVFDELPDIPYLGIREYLEQIMEIPVTLETDGEGVVTLRNGNGGELVCNAAAGTVFTPDWIRVISPKLPLETTGKGLKDSSCAFVRITEIAYEGDPAPVTFDFAKYGMKIFTDDRDVYLPLFVLSNMFTDVATRHLRYDGENLYLNLLDLDGTPDDPVLTGENLAALLGGKERPADLISQCYAGLCFTFDYFFGHPGRAEMDAALAEKGLDQALEERGEEGRAIREGLLSPSMTEYLAAMARLFTVCLYDGHTSAADIAAIMDCPTYADCKELHERLGAEGFLDMMRSKNSVSQILSMAVTPQRKMIWGDKVYRECGRTAIIRLDSFMPDEKAWDLYYKGEGPFPEDCVGTVAAGLRRAKENPEIENVLFDLTCNHGGSSDALMMILGLTTGRNDLLGRNSLTGQAMRSVFETDNNFDGVFDEKDQEARFDFNYGVLTTRQAFSCGNLFPVVMRESGAVVIGEPSGGGSCCIQIGTDAHGIRYMMSSCQWQLLDEDGGSVEPGCRVDIPIKTRSIGLIDRLISSTLGVDDGLPGYAAYFDEEYLNTLMNAWFHVTELAPAA